ncbi:hypothetical protein RB195_014907 [Necator americanus]|uniref:Uncharacterized protein n=1 Tax=Necator americanus TaxID=51031 RepID=A0ABR1E243_NECAM
MDTSTSNTTGSLNIFTTTRRRLRVLKLLCLHKLLIHQCNAPRTAGIKELASELVTFRREAIKEGLEDGRAAVPAEAAEASKSSS